MIDIEAIRKHWHPIAASNDLPLRHVFHAQVLGRELAVWRADDGNVNAWENRCLHRGVRLSIGVNDGTELVCQYHGWRYANRTAGCTYIPAHPADAPARTICNNTYPVKEKHGLIWCTELPATTEPLTLETADKHIFTPLFAPSVNATLAQTANGLMTHFSVATLAGVNPVNKPLRRINDFTLSATRLPDEVDHLVLYLQPANAGRTIVRGAIATKNALQGIDKIRLLKHYSVALNTCRRKIESIVVQQPAPTDWQPMIKRVSEVNSTMPEQTVLTSHSTLRLQVTRIDQVADAIKSFRLESISGQLPSAQPGAHIDIHLPNGLTRQYSLINGPGQTDHYAIAVKRVTDSTGGSEVLHTTLKPGDVIASSAPRNNFSLRRDAVHTHLIAGGIGITPLLSMARAMSHAKLPFTLHYFVTNVADIVFKSELEQLRGNIHFHTGLSTTLTQEKLQDILRDPLAHHHVYLCGPAGMLSAAIQTAQDNHWSDAHVHFEYFKNTTQRDTSSSFTVELARSGLTLAVPTGKSLLEILRENTVSVPSSCEQGTCGTCRVSVLEGTPDHQDVYLSDTDKARNHCLMSCVSRAKSDKLVLDL